MAYDFEITKYSDSAPEGTPAFGLSSEDRDSIREIAKSVIEGDFGNRVNIRQDDNNPISVQSLADTRGGREILDELKNIISHYPEGHFDHPSEMSGPWDTVFNELCDAYDLINDSKAFDVLNEREDSISRAEYNEKHPKIEPSPINDVGMPWYLKRGNGIEPHVREQYLTDFSEKRPLEFNEASEKMLQLRAEGKPEAAEKALYEVLLDMSDKHREENGYEPYERGEIDYTIDDGAQFNSYDEYKRTGTEEKADLPNRDYADRPEMAAGKEGETKMSNEREYVDVPSDEIVSIVGEAVIEAYKDDPIATKAIEEYLEGNISQEELVSQLESRNIETPRNDIESTRAAEGTSTTADRDKSQNYEEKYGNHAEWLNDDRGNVRMFGDTVRAYHKVGEVYNAYKAGIEINGKVPSSVDVGISALNFLRSNPLETLVIAVLRYAIEHIAGKDDVEKKGVEADNKNIDANPEVIKDNVGVNDNGYISKDDINTAASDVERSRDVNEKSGEFYGFDMTKESKNSTNDCTIYNSDKSISATNVSNAEKVSIPSMRLVEMKDRIAIVEPFGKVVHDIAGKGPSYYSGLDVSKNPKIASYLESEAKASGVSVNEVKDKISIEARSAHVDKISNSFEKEIEALEKQISTLKVQGADIDRYSNAASLIGNVAGETLKREDVKEKFNEIKISADDAKIAIVDRIGALSKRESELKSYDVSALRVQPLESREAAVYRSEANAVGRTANTISPYDEFKEKYSSTIEKGVSYVEKAIDVCNDLRRDQVGNDSQRISLDKSEYKIADRFGYVEGGKLSKGEIDRQANGDISVKEKILTGIEKVSFPRENVVDMSDYELSKYLHDDSTTSEKALIADTLEAKMDNPELFKDVENELLKELDIDNVNDIEKDTEDVEDSKIPETEQEFNNDITSESDDLVKDVENDLEETVLDIEDKQPEDIEGTELSEFELPENETLPESETTEETAKDENKDISYEETEKTEPDVIADSEEQDTEEQSDKGNSDYTSSDEYGQDNIETNEQNEAEKEKDKDDPVAFEETDDVETIEEDASGKDVAFEGDSSETDLKDEDNDEDVEILNIEEADSAQDDLQMADVDVTESPIDKEDSSALRELVSDIFSFRDTDDEGRSNPSLTDMCLDNIQNKLEKMADVIDRILSADTPIELIKEISSIIGESFVDAIKSELGQYENLIKAIGGEKGEEFIDFMSDMASTFMENLTEMFGTELATNVDVSVSNILNSGEIPTEVSNIAETALDAIQYGAFTEIPIELTENLAIDGNELFNPTTGDDVVGFESESVAQETVDNIVSDIEQTLQDIEFNPDVEILDLDNGIDTFFDTDSGVDKQFYDKSSVEEVDIEPTDSEFLSDVEPGSIDAGLEDIVEEALEILLL